MQLQSVRLCSILRGTCTTPEHPLTQFLSLFPGFRLGRPQDRVPRRGPVPLLPSWLAPPQCAEQGSGWTRCPRTRGARSRAGAVSLPEPHPSAFGEPSPGPAMGNMPSAVKHCLSYQQLLREHLWIADSVAGALDPAQVPPRGPGCPHPLAHCQPASPPLGHLALQGPWC